MGVNWGEPLSKGLKFAVHPKRWLMFFIVDLVFLGSIVWMFFSNIGEFTAVLAALSTDPTAILPVLGSLGGMLALFIIWILVRLGAVGSVIHQTYKDKDPVRKSLSVCYRKYLSLLGAAIIIAIISGVLGMVPVLGSLLTILFSLTVFFVFQGVIIKGSGGIKSINESWKIFKGGLREFKAAFEWKFIVWVAVVIVSTILTVFSAFVAPEAAWGAVSFWVMMVALSWLAIYSRVADMWLLISIIAGVITLIFMLPAFGMIVTLMLSAGEATSAAAIAAFLFSIIANPGYFFIVFVILLIGAAISNCFALKATTEYYLQIRKRFKLI